MPRKLLSKTQVSSANFMESAWFCSLPAYCAAPIYSLRVGSGVRNREGCVQQQVKHCSVTGIVLVINLNHSTIHAPMKKIDSNLVSTSIVPCL